MATPRGLEVIHADIMIAKNILYPQNGDTSKQTPYLLNQAAYHSEQAVEKSLKAIIRAKNEQPDERVLKTHNIESLLLKAEMCQPNFILEHSFISENAHKLSCFNELRYGDESVNKADTYILYKEARTLFQELEKDYLKEFPDKKQFHNTAVQQYKELKHISLKTDISKFSKKSVSGKQDIDLD